MTNKKVYENTKAYYELFYAHKMQSRVLYETQDRFDVSFSELITEGVKAMEKLETLDTSSDEHYRAFHDKIEIQNEQRRFHRSLCSAQHAKGITILPSVDYVDYPF